MKKYKKLLRNIYTRTQRPIYELFANPKFTPKPSLNNIDDGLEKYFSYSKGFFIEVGANDGWKQSNTYYLEFGRRWRGILIEAVPELYQKCRKFRKRSRVFNCALVGEDYKATEITIHYADLMSIVNDARDLESIKMHVEEGIAYQKLTETYEITVPARTLSSIIKDCNIKSIDFFSLDVEGYELQVLKGMKLYKNRPKFILVETKGFDGVYEYLVANDYQQIDKLSYHDFLFKDRFTI